MCPIYDAGGIQQPIKKMLKVLVVAAKCGLEEDTYIESNLITGSIEMEFRYMKSLKLNPTKFYRLYQNQISRVMPSNKATKDDITEFECQHDIVTPQHQGINNKAVFCVRAYKDFPQLYDVLYLGISIDKARQALLSHFTISGVAKETAQAFTQQFMESVSWN